MGFVRFCKAITTLGPVGYSVAPGTTASLIVFVALYFLKPMTPQAMALQIAGATFLVSFLSVFVVQKYEACGDRPEIVIDELVGSIVTMMFVPHKIWLYILGFVLFRIFDIKKPWCIGSCEFIPGTWGIMADDIAAGFMSNIILFLTLIIYGAFAHG